MTSDRDAADDRSARGDNGGDRRVLIAEDDPSSRDLLIRAVEVLGYDVDAVADGEAAWEAAQVRLPDLILSDVTMPGLDGFGLCRRLKADPRTRLIPVILITGIGEEHKVEGIEAGADDFLGKPVSLNDVRVRMRSLIRMKAFTDELESAETVLMTLAASIEAKDPYTEGHCERLAELGRSLGLAMGADHEMLTALQRGGYLHDLGKIGVPEHILLKPRALTADEREVIQQHSVTGERICRPLRSFRAVLPIIRHHHEKCDGSGYPDGLTGEAIPLGARILQVVDVFDALTTDRPYRRALPWPDALIVLEAETKRGWWDRRIVRVFHEVVATRLVGGADSGAGAPS